MSQHLQLKTGGKCSRFAPRRYPGVNKQQGSELETKYSQAEKSLRRCYEPFVKPVCQRTHPNTRFSLPRRRAQTLFVRESIMKHKRTKQLRIFHALPGTCYDTYCHDRKQDRFATVQPSSDFGPNTAEPLCDRIDFILLPCIVHINCCCASRKYPWRIRKKLSPTLTHAHNRPQLRRYAPHKTPAFSLFSNFLGNNSTAHHLHQQTANDNCRETTTDIDGLTSGLAGNVLREK